ncbi:ATP-binding protein [Acidovorax sp. SUPP2825]|uniref:ATP-binding protein n=1 Tax=Acidovorax sp. SUPP2825 TaxID=2920879 RepID=UPI0023DE62A6|nr:ATP-binding protein [Acidovorax sp. SUPP2825]GKS96713.1 HAMP domain-containing protein [Acidovorax sp. SUPP2825]
MTAAYGLRRQLVVSLAVMAIGIALLFLLGSYALFALLMAFSPSSISDDLTPSPIEAMWMLCTVLVALVLAVVTAVKLSRRIVVPLNSVAESLRRIAEGDLSARATTDDHSLGETAQLVRDFNSMAERLQHMAQQRAFWNAAIAHELRTPVTILRGRLQGMTEGVFEPTPTQFQGLLKNVEGLGRLIEDLRLLGLKDSGHLELHLELADLAAEVGAVAQAFEPQLRAAGFALTLDLNPQEVLCDPVRIRQALLALLENALRHATPGAMRIRHWVEGEMCHLCVEDSGPGLNADDAARLFDAFQRGEASRGPSSGSGLGLAVVQAIAQAHEGQASWAPSRLGGSAFALQWPV